jgi:hypothetical protein
MCPALVTLESILNAATAQRDAATGRRNKPSPLATGTSGNASAVVTLGTNSNSLVAPFRALSGTLGATGK